MNQVSQPPSMPLLIRFSMWLAAFYSLWLIGGLVLAISSDAVSIGSNVALDSTLWIKLFGPLYGIKAALMAAIACGFYKQRRWARHLMILLWFIVIVYVLIAFGAKEFLHRQMKWEIIQATMLAALAIWYFYYKRGVVKYYQTLTQG
jgi:hypothetical protein